MSRTDQVRCSVKRKLSQLLARHAPATMSINSAVHPLSYRTAGTRTVILFRRHLPRQLPTLSCEHRCPPRNRLRPSFHLLGMEAENARNSSNAPSRAATAVQSAHTYRLNHAFWIKHHHGLNSSSVTTTSYRSKPGRHHTVARVHFHCYWRAVNGP